MNYLAHAYLSFDDPEILVGNMISDFVKGKKKLDYPEGIRNGITLHRIIDMYADEHPATHEAKNYFRPVYRLYSGAFIDVVYDHFLANDEAEFLPSTLSAFSRSVYTVLERAYDHFPSRFANMFPYMKTQDWLYNYRTKAGTTQSFSGLVRRAAYLEDSRPAAEIFEKYYQPLGSCYRQFWADAKPFVKRQFEVIKEGGGLS